MKWHEGTSLSPAEVATKVKFLAPRIKPGFEYNKANYQVCGHWLSRGDMIGTAFELSQGGWWHDRASLRASFTLPRHSPSASILRRGAASSGR